MNPRERKGRPRSPEKALQSPSSLLRARHAPEFSAAFIEEPKLTFGGNHQTVDPKVGLALYGPIDLSDPARRSVVRVGLIGTGPLVDLARSWFARCERKITPIRLQRVDGVVKRVHMDPTVFTPFPGTEMAFGTRFVLSDATTETLSAREVAEVEKIGLFEPRVTRLVNLVVERLRVLMDKASPPDVVVCSLPTKLRRLCTTPTRHRHRKASARTAAAALAADLEEDARVGQGNLFDIAAIHGINLENPTGEHSIFHHGLKARAMATNIPTQLVWEDTLVGATTVEDDATRAWNFWTGMFYKAGGVPWRVSGLSTGTCYAGIAFYREKDNPRLRSCMAQVFSPDENEGIVLRSEPFQWDGWQSPHLPEQLASDLMRRIVDAYTGHRRQPPSRVVVHKWQRYWPEERAGFEAALTQLVDSYDLVAFGDRGLRLFRAGIEPPLRGTMVQLGPGNALLYTLGYVPFLGQYPGMRVPKPLEIAEHIGSGSLRQVSQEILALTKLDWNSSRFAGRQPITTAFSEDVGHILAELPAGIAPKTQYRFYM